MLTRRKKLLFQYVNIPKEADFTILKFILACQYAKRTRFWHIN